MKGISTLFLLTFLVVTGLNTLAQDSRTYEAVEHVLIRGNETGINNNTEVIEISGTTTFSPVQTRSLTFNVHNITDRMTGYDFQSNASTQQVWVDHANNPGYVHATFTHSSQTFGWSDRTCLYFGSVDDGVNWFELGPTPVTGRAGFPAIYGNSTSAGVLMNHNNFFGGFTRSTVMIDTSPFGYSFTSYDPGDLNDGPVWPRHVVDQNDDVIFATSGAPDAILHVNTLDVSTGQFTGWQDMLDGEEGELYDLSVSDNGKIGFVYGGKAADAGDVIYKESTDGGLTWSDRVIVFDSDATQDTIFGIWNGISVNFMGENPCVTYEVGFQIPPTSFFPGLPSEIHFWSPTVNGGTPIVIADSSIVPYYPYAGTNDGHIPVCRPVLGRSAMHDYLFVAFNATTENVFPSPVDTTTYMAGYFTYSSNAGNTWSDPEMFTPTSPLRDWRYPSIGEINPVATTDDDAITVHIVMQSDTIPGSTIDAGTMPVGVTAQYNHFSTEIMVTSTGKDPLVINDYNLEQNYPNPFNPSTTIKFSIPERSGVTLTVYDVLGNEVSLLLDKELETGTHSVDFNSSDYNLSSGVYFYTLKSNDYTQTKKLILMK
jgi:hypothetical protein